MHKGERSKKNEVKEVGEIKPIKNVGFYHKSTWKLADNVRERCDMIRLHIKKVTESDFLEIK